MKSSSRGLRRRATALASGLIAFAALLAACGAGPIGSGASTPELQISSVWPGQSAGNSSAAHHSELSGRDYQRIQILTIRDLLEEHRQPDLPLLVLPAYQQAERVEKKAAEQGELFG